MFGDIEDGRQMAEAASVFVDDGMESQHAPQGRPVRAPQSALRAVGCRAVGLPAQVAGDDLGHFAFGQKLHRRRGRRSRLVQAQHVGHAAIHVGGVAVPVEHPNAFVGGFDDAAEFDFARGKTLFGLAARSAFGGLSNFSLDRRHQARQVVLDQDIVRARLEYLDGGLFAHRPGNDQKGNVWPDLLEDRDRGQRVESGQRVVADDDVPGLLLEGGAKGIRRVHAVGVDRVAAFFQVANDEKNIVLGVLEKQNAELGAHVRPPSALGD